jgi:hypothetical protein
MNGDTTRLFKGAAHCACAVSAVSGGVGNLNFESVACRVCGVSVTMMITTDDVTEPNNFLRQVTARPTHYH